MCPEHAVEVRTVEMHNGHQHVGRCDSCGTSPTGYMEGVLGDLCDHIAIIDTGRSGSRTLGALALHLEGTFTYSERL